MENRAVFRPDGEELRSDRDERQKQQLVFRAQQGASMTRNTTAELHTG